MTCVTRVEPAVRGTGGWAGQDAELSMPSDSSLQEPQPYLGGGGGVVNCGKLTRKWTIDKEFFSKICYAYSDPLQ